MCSARARARRGARSGALPFTTASSRPATAAPYCAAACAAAADARSTATRDCSRKGRPRMPPPAEPRAPPARFAPPRRLSPACQSAQARRFIFARARIRLMLSRRAAVASSTSADASLVVRDRRRSEARAKTLRMRRLRVAAAARRRPARPRGASERVNRLPARASSPASRSFSPASRSLFRRCTGERARASAADCSARGTHAALGPRRAPGAARRELSVVERAKVSCSLARRTPPSARQSPTRARLARACASPPRAPAPRVHGALVLDLFFAFAVASAASRSLASTTRRGSCPGAPAPPSTRRTRRGGGTPAVGEELGDVAVRSRELSRAFACRRSRVGGARTSGNRARSGWAPPPKSVDDSLFFRAERSLREGRSSELSTGRARNRGPSRRARKIRRDSRGDRDAHSDVPHLPVRPPSPRAPRLRTGTPRRRSGHRLRRNGPTRPCPSSRSWRSARRSRAEPSRRRVSDPVGSEERAKRPTTLSAGRVCAALRTVTARQTLPKIFRRRCCPRNTKKVGALFAAWGDVRLRGCRAPQASRSRPGHHTVRRERLSASTRGRRDTTMRIYTPAEVRPEPPPTHPRDGSPHPDGRARPVVPKSGDADPARPGEDAARSTRERSRSRVFSARAPITPTTTRRVDVRRRVATRASSAPRDAR